MITAYRLHAFCRATPLPFVVALTCCVSTALSAPVTQVVQSPDIRIEYESNRDATPLTSVVLWYTVDDGVSWVQSVADEDLRSPVQFHAAADGAYGFFLVLANATGASSQPPTSGTQPQASVVVDQTPPVVQLHELRRSVVFGEPVVQIRWTALDALFPPRPIEIQYRSLTDATWRSATLEPMANTGRFEWSPPLELSGLVTMRVVARDRGGHVAESDPQSIDMTRSAAPASPQPGGSNSQVSGAASLGQVESTTVALPAVSGSPRSRERAELLIADAKAHRDGGDLRGAIARLRDAVRLDPNRTDAFAEMAGLFYGLGDWDRALGAYEIVLQHQPRDRSALLGVARAQTQRKDFNAAGEHLRAILRHDPGDAEVWMSLGDVAIYGGDEVLARDCYLRATQIDPAAISIVEDARKRLQLMDDVSRRYGG